MLTAITRGVSRTLADCELTWLARAPIDIDRAIAQHREYERCLAELGARVISLPAAEEHPDGVFVEDPAIVLDEVAVIASMGCESRRGERASLAAALAEYRPLIRMRDPARLEGGDVMRIGKDLFVGLSARTDEAGVAQLSDVLRSFGYRVIPVALRACLHLKSACSYLGEGSILINRDWLDARPLGGFRLIDVAPDEPGAANALRVGETVLMPSAFPATAALLRKAGFGVHVVDLTELLKAESGVTCSSLLFEA
ncbi:MAG: arginine deiminase family protein [Acidobacteriota bacterium]